jgi:hypothetical protein
VWRLLLHVASKKETPIRQNFLEKPDKATKNLAIEFDVTPMINCEAFPKSRINPGWTADEENDPAFRLMISREISIITALHLDFLIFCLDTLEVRRFDR